MPCLYGLSCSISSCCCGHPLSSVSPPPPSISLCLSGSFFQLSVLLGLEVRMMTKLSRSQRNSFFTISQPHHSVPAHPKHVSQLPSLTAATWSFLGRFICQGWDSRASPHIERTEGGPRKVPAFSVAGVRWIWERVSNTTDAPHARQPFPRPSFWKQRMNMTSCSDARVERVPQKECLGSGHSSFYSTLQ